MLAGKSSMTKLHWRHGLVVGIFLAVFACYPQLKMWYVEGANWQGHYAYNDIDEVAYASYLKALIDGRPRKNDPYSGRDESQETPQSESLFSIQFAAPYSVAIPARIFGISAPNAMIVAGAMAGLVAGLCCFWLIGLLTDDSIFAMAGSLVVLCGGALAAGEGAIGEILGTGVSYPYFPFLRRYVPAIPFPVFFALLASVWHLLKSNEGRKRIFWCCASAGCFSFLVYSYFYLWTTAAAWLFCVSALWLTLCSKDRARDLKTLSILGALCSLPLIIYMYLLSERAEAMDNTLLLVYTRELDLWRFPEYISFFVLLVIFSGVLFKILNIRSRKTVFAISFALVPIIIFNQQLITARSLQPIHYQVFIGNYVSLLALVVATGLLWRGIADRRTKLSSAIFCTIALAAVAWGFVECHYTVRILDRANSIRDKGIPLARRLTELSKTDDNPNRTTILSIDTIQSDDSPTVAPQNVLWARHQHVFAGLSARENKERYYQYLYYQNLDEKWLAARLKKRDFVSMITLFGWARHSNRLSAESKPLTQREIEEESKRYGEYRKKFGVEEAASPRLSYVVFRKNRNIDFTNIDKWYLRNEGETVGIYRLYKVTLRSTK